MLSSSSSRGAADARSTTFPPVERLVAHAPPMRLVNEIVEELDAGLVARVVIGEDFVFLRDGEVDAVVCIELVAQTVACFVGLAELREGVAPRGGLLVGCRDARFHVEKLRLGDDLLVRVRRQWIREPAASFTGEVVRKEEVLATVELSVVSGAAASLLADGGWSGDR